MDQELWICAKKWEIVMKSANFCQIFSSSSEQSEYLFILHSFRALRHDQGVLWTRITRSEMLVDVLYDAILFAKP